MQNRTGAKAPTIDEVIFDLDSQLAEHRREYSSARNRLEAILANAEAEGRGRLTEYEDQMAESLMKQAERADAGQRRIESMLDRARAVKADEENPAAPPVRKYSAAPREGSTCTAEFSIGREERTYHAGNDPEGKGFLADVARSATNDPQAFGRLERHMQEERVERPQYMERTSNGVGTSAFTGLVVPQFLTDQYAKAVANMRPYADSIQKRPLPESGMEVKLSRITTSSSAALQATELAAVSLTDMADTLLTVPVQTVAASQLISRQALERGSGVEEVALDDMMRRVASELDNTLLNQATNGLQTVSQAVTWTEAAPDGPKMYPFIFKATSQAEAALKAMARVDMVLMHPRRWNWLCSQVSTSWPFMGAAGSGVPDRQSALQLTNEYGPSVRGVLANGLKVGVDFNVSTTAGAGTEDVIYVYASDAHVLWESPGAPMLIRAEQPKAPNLGVYLVLYQYLAYTHAKWTNAASRITGTGLAAAGCSGF